MSLTPPRRLPQAQGSVVPAPGKKVPTSTLVNFRCPTDLYTKFKAACKDSGHTVTLVLLDWIKEHVASTEAEKAKPGVKITK